MNSFILSIARSTALGIGIHSKIRAQGTWRGRVYCLTRWVIGLLFLYSGVSKLLDPAAFAMIIDDFGLLPDAWARSAAFAIAGLESMAGIGLLFEIRMSLSVITGLLILFMAVLAYGIHLGLDIDCGCFGPNDLESAVYGGLRKALYRDMALMAGVLYLYWWRCKRNMQTDWRPVWLNLFNT